MNKKMKFFLKCICFVFFVLISIKISVCIVNNEINLAPIKNIQSFFETIELKTFDARQKFYVHKKQTSNEIIILEIDEKTYSTFTEKMGEWPVSRKVYADVINFVQKDKPLAIGLDLLFINSDKYNKQNDIALVKALSEYENVFTSINFDNVSPELRAPAVLEARQKVKVENYSGINPLLNKNLIFTNCRTLIDEIMSSNAQLGEINSFFDVDGTLRALYPFVIYDDDFYPQLAVKIAMFIEEKRTGKKIDKLIIDRAANVIIGDKKIPLRSDTGIILNWYSNKNVKKISFIDVYNAALNSDEPTKFPKNFFKNKIIYVGSTAVALFDLKNSPVNSALPGVYLHTTFLNNLLDNNFIHRTSSIVDFCICAILCGCLAFFMFKFKKQVIEIFLLLIIMGIYIILSGFAMDKYNLWLPLVTPVSTLVITFITVYIIKYFKKSKDFEYTYKLATTDGLTELYNHRYFQEQLLYNIENYKRFDIPFSLILLDIDFFKKFNDKYGHQAGDRVLKHVSNILKKQVRATDIVARYGGEEMTIILTSTRKNEAELVAQKVCDTIAISPIELDGNTEVMVTVSLGVATCPENGVSANDLIEEADKALYISKNNGRNQVTVAKKAEE